ncbi:hypothetical protein EVB27_014 [Rhizobium phage RHph_TM16]|nr:hypothetical protein EVB27_014 [Rhizobium phage RHph_TM16]
MTIRASFNYATQRFVEYTGLVIILALALALSNTFGTAAFSTAGEYIQESLMPTLEARNVAINDPATGKVTLATYPAFAVTEQQWVGRDLLLVSGTLCKAHDYDFQSMKAAFGTPDGMMEPARIEFLTPVKTGRTTGCQTWKNWLLVGAGETPLSSWFVEITHMPKHKLWPIRQTIGPFKLPDRSILKAG